MAAPAKEIKFCSKCGINQRADQNGTNPWCLECRSAYQSVYNQTIIDREKRKAFADGSTAMREALAALFAHWPTAYFSGTEIASKIQRAEAPTART
jgi:NADH pyrophosphatase NudC (nudix superfamily)